MTQSSSLLQAFPQPPQFSESVRVLTQPPAQSVVPPVQVPAAQAGGLPLQIVPVPHAVPQAPQFAADVRLTQRPPHDPSPGLHTHAPAEQYSPSAHALPQVPQLRGSSVSTAQVEPPPVPHAVAPVGHAQTPAVHVAVKPQL